MGKLATALDAAHEEFIARQHVFFVATAPLAASGHVNLSPKGLDSLRVLGPSRIVYVDRAGSGIETVAHLRENGRIVMMFCAFEGPPKILRIHGRGRSVETGDDEFALVARFPEQQGVRSLIVVDVLRVAESCGYGVPVMRYEKDREQLDAWARKKGEDGLRAYERERNRVSVDGLPGLARAQNRPCS